MKVSIEGFNQEYAVSLRTKKEAKGKEKLVKIDCTDLVILRWFVDFYPKMKKVVVDGEEYAWLSHKKIVEDLPIVDISKRAFSERLQKLVDFKILKYKLIKENGTFTIYGFGENYAKLVEGSSSNNKGCEVQTTKGSSSNDIGCEVQTTTKDKTINNKTINNKTIIKENTSIKDADVLPNEENILKNEFEELWLMYPKKRGKKEAYESYCKYRKSIGVNYTTKGDVEKGIINYNNYIRENHIQDRYIKYGSKFFEERSWEDDYTLPVKVEIPNEILDYDWLNDYSESYYELA